ncbi:MAG: flagellin [Opitutaceae bacterium]|jgi:flagellin|nr:flagellin [Opitutaceae bacterium]
MVINTNQNAVEATSALQRSQSAMNRSMARLSTGNKIVKPSDDTAGLSISEKIQAQNSRIEAAQTNIQNAVSLSQTTDGFLESMGEVLNRMNELAVMASDVTKTAEDRDLYGLEFEQMKDQLRDTIGVGDNGTDSDPNWNASGTTPIGSFNGISLFGARADMIVMVGASGGQSMNVSQVNLREIGSGVSDLIWDSSVDGSQSDIDVDSSNVLQALDAAVAQVAQERANIGAEQSRLGVVGTQLQVQQENLMAANSRIRDVDVAVESTCLAKNQILTEASVSMLHKANGLPQAVLRLLV